MPNPYLGHLMRISGMTAGYPEIPWITIELEIGTPADNRWEQYQTDLMSINTEVGSSEYHVQDSVHVYGFAPFGHRYLFDTVDIKSYKSLLNAAETAALNHDETYPFELSYFSADIPAVIQITDEANVGNAHFRLNGTDVYTNYAHPQVGNGVLWATGASIITAPNVDPAPYAIQNFTVNYNNPDPYLGGMFPPGTGSAEYELKTLFLSGGKTYARFGKV